jgi:hypothetical protein
MINAGIIMAFFFLLTLKFCESFREERVLSEEGIEGISKKKHFKWGRNIRLKYVK